jgi:hypothetical protein
VRPQRGQIRHEHESATPVGNSLTTTALVVALRIDAGVLSWIDVTGYTRGSSETQRDEEKSTAALAVLSSGK